VYRFQCPLSTEHILRAKILLFIYKNLRKTTKYAEKINLFCVFHGTSDRAKTFFTSTKNMRFWSALRILTFLFEENEIKRNQKNYAPLSVSSIYKKSFNSNECTTSEKGGRFGEAFSALATPTSP